MSEENEKMEENVEKEKTLEEKVNDINHYDGICLEDTINLMKSDNYKERFIAEYMQTKIRYNNLHKMLVKADAGTLGFELTCDVTILEDQAYYMGNYLKELEIRAEIEGITLPHC